MSTTHSRVLVALLAAALLLTGGAAVATGKIKANQIAKNAIRTKHLKAGSVTGEKLAPGAVTGDKIAPNSITGPKLAGDSVTGVQVDESSLRTVPNAAAVGGITMVPIQMSLPDPTVPLTPFFTMPGVSIFVTCSSITNVEVDRTGAPPVTLESNRSSFGTDMVSLSGGLGLGADAANYTVTVFGQGTQTTVIRLEAVHSADAFGGTDDCFYRGTVTSTP